MNKSVRPLIGIVLSALLLWFAFRGIPLADAWRQAQLANGWLLAGSALVGLATYPIRVVRWGVLLEPASPGTSFSARLRATLIGFGLNNVLPARLGEIARPVALKSLAGVPVAAGLSSVALERVFDAISVVTMLAVAMSIPGFPLSTGGFDPREKALIAGAGAAALIGLLLLLVHKPDPTLRGIDFMIVRRLPEKWRDATRGALVSFIAGLGVLRSGRLFALTLGWSFLHWFVNGLSFYVGMMAFGIQGPGLAGAMFLAGLIALGVALPQAPGFFGGFEAAFRVALTMWGVSAVTSTAFAVAFHLAGFVPLTVIGLGVLWQSGITLRPSQSVAMQEGT